MEPLTIKPAAELLGIRQDSLLNAARAGWIPFRWGDTPRGQKQRLFALDDLRAYAQRQRERVHARLAKLDEVVAG